MYYSGFYLDRDFLVPLGTVPTLQDPAGPQSREAGEELGGTDGILDLALPSSWVLGLCVRVSDLHVSNGNSNSVMDYSDGLRVNCRVRGGERSAIISSKGSGRPGPGSDPGVRVEQRVQSGGLVGRLGQQDQD